jgi:hypothetical protein
MIGKKGVIKYKRNLHLTIEWRGNDKAIVENLAGDRNRLFQNRKTFIYDMDTC